MTEPTIADELAQKDLWHKLAGALVAKLGGSDVLLTAADFQAIDGMTVVVSHEQLGTAIRLRVLPDAEAQHISATFQHAAKRKN